MRQKFNFPLIVNFAKVYCNKIIFSSVVLCGIMYVTIINSLAIQGFALENIQKEYNVLVAENRALELEATHLRSYQYSFENINKSNIFVQANDLEYLDSREEFVARK